MAKQPLTQTEVSQLNDLAVFLSYKMSDIDRKFLHLPHKIIGLFSGNQKGKTCVAMYSTVLSILGRHPVVEKNFDYYKCACGEKWNATKVPKDRKCPTCAGEIKLFSNSVRTARLCSETLPGETTDAKGETSTEVKNTLYPELKKWSPAFLIKKDITARSPKMVYKSGVGGPDIVVEFVSYNQSVQSTAGSQRFIIKCDEEPPKPFWDEQLPRLLAADGWLELTLTPANYITWTHDEIYDRASAYYRSKIIADKFGVKEEEIIRDDNQIAVMQAATDDNPTLRPEVIERLFEKYDDEDMVAIRRYGVFKQISGRVFKDFDRLHVINESEIFPDGINDEYYHARGCDYHGRNPWAIGWLALSSDNELFVYNEYGPSPELNTTDAIAKETAEISGDYRYKLNLVDPLIKASNGQSNKGPNCTVLDDLNDSFSRLKKAGVGTGGYWEPWDTKSEHGRDAIKMRLKNSVICGRPFNNVQTREGQRVVLPTIWFFSRCKNFINSMKTWRYNENPNTGASQSKEAPNTPQQKWSHYPMVIEGILKDARFRPLQKRPMFQNREFKDDRYFRRGVA